MRTSCSGGREYYGSTTARRVMEFIGSCSYPVLSRMKIVHTVAFSPFCGNPGCQL